MFNQNYLIMSHVTNVITNRQILMTNAQWSQTHDGYIHVSSMVRVVIKFETMQSARYQVSTTYDYVHIDHFSANKKHWNVVTNDLSRTNSNVSYVSYTGLTSTDKGPLKEFEIDGVACYSLLEVDSNDLPDWMMRNVDTLEYVDGSSNQLVTYKSFASMNPANRPVSLTTGPVKLKKVNTSMRVPLFRVFSDGAMNSNISSRWVTYTDIDGSENHNEVFYVQGGETANNIQRFRSSAMLGGGNRTSIFGYHRSGTFRSQFDASIETGKWYFGIEAEKQDETARSYANYLGGQCGKWGAESDSSLGRGGVEFISPILPLHDTDTIRREFHMHRWMLDAKLDNGGNANRTSCGGHITISKGGMSGRELLAHFHHFVPLFYSLYIGRLNTSYGGAVTKQQVSHSRRAFNLKSFGIEVRIFSGVPSMEGAWWRVRLLQVIADMIDSGEVNSYKDVANAMVSDKHPLRKVMRKMYDSKRIRDKFGLVLAMGHLYENDGNSVVDISGTSDSVLHKTDRVLNAFSEFSNVRECTRNLWGVDGITIDR